MVYNDVYVSCGPGWKDLYEPLIDLCKLKDIRVDQVKEKFGGLRFYVNRPDLDTIIHAAELLSWKLCETCGTEADVTLNTTGWRKTLCDLCRKKRNDDKP